MLLVDKPRGLTSHDVVRLVRKAVGTRAVGHAGTLDPMATGLLVLAIGEGCKILRWLAATDKRYAATIALGRETSSLDADGEVVREIPLSCPLTPSGVERAAAGFIGRSKQRVPAVSAVKRDGVPLYARVRRGEHVEPPEREVTVHRLDVLAVRSTEIDLEVVCGPGFYVRALARDLAHALGTVGHLVALRRLASGSFSIDHGLDAETLSEGARGLEHARGRVLGAVRSIEEALPEIPRCVVDAQGRQDARHGRPVARTRVLTGWPSEPVEPVLLLGEDGEVIAIARASPEDLRVVRGLSPTRD